MSDFPEIAEELVSGFVSGDPVAMDTVISLILPPLVRWAQTQYRDLPADEVESLMMQVVSEIYFKHNNYDPTRSKLTTYIINLYRLRINDLYNRENKIIQFEAVLDPEREISSQHPYNFTDKHDTRMAHLDTIQQLREQLDEPDREFLDLILKGTKSSQQFADVLSKYQHVSDPQRDVKNARTRLMRRLKKLAADMDVSVDDLFE
jgi:DNA repair exonuclease SbcCD ATPase subunit